MLAWCGKKTTPTPKNFSSRDCLASITTPNTEKEGIALRIFQMVAALLLSLTASPALLAGPAKLAASPAASKRAAAPAMQVMQAGPMTPARAMVYESQQRAYWNPMTSEAELYGGFGGYGYGHAHSFRAPHRLHSAAPLTARR